MIYIWLNGLKTIMTPEEKETYRKEWFRKSEERRVLIAQISAHAHDCPKITECEEYQDLVLKLRDLDPSYCEHGRSWASECMACDQQHMEAFPEYYNKCDACQNLVDLDGLDQSNHCMDCHIDQ